MHVTGQLEIFKGEDLRELVKSVIQLLRAGGHHKKVLVTPMQRYVAAPCCNDPDHIVNFGRPTYSADMVAGLATIREVTRKAASNHRITNYRYKVASFEKMLDWRDDTNNKTLKDNLSPDGYRKVPVVDNLEDWSRNGNAFSNTKPATNDRRQRWVANDNNFVNRRPSPDRT